MRPGERCRGKTKYIHRLLLLGENRGNLHKVSKLAIAIEELVRTK